MSPYGADNEAQAVRTDMRLGQIAHLGWSTKGGQLFQHPGDQRILRTAGQFAVGKGSGTAFAELDVALRVKQAASPELLDVEGALLNRLSPFDDRGGQAILGKTQRREQAGRSAADDDQLLLRVHGGEYGCLGFCLPFQV